MEVHTYLTRCVVGLIGFGLAYGVVRLAGWSDLRWLATGVPIMTGVIVMALVDVWRARNVRR